MSHFNSNVSSGSGGTTITITPTAVNNTTSDITETVTIQTRGGLLRW